MTTSTVRLAVRGAIGTVDLVVQLSAPVEVLGREYAATVGLPEAPALVSLDGHLLPPRQTVHTLGLRHGSVLVALDGPPDLSGEDAPGEARSAAQRVSEVHPGPGLVPVAQLAGLLAAVAATYAEDWRLRAAVAGVLLLGAVLALAPRASTTWGATRAAAPGLAAAGGFTGAWDDSSGGLLLAVAVAGLAAGAAAALGRTDVDQRFDDLMRVWLAAAVTVTLAAALLLLVGAGDQALWAVLLAAAVLVAKLLPGSVVGVPDHLLLDLERLAVTAWTARDRPTGGRRRRMTVHAESVADVVHRGHRLIAAVAVGVAATTLVSAPLLLVAADEGSVAWGARLEVLLAGAALALMSRSYRARLPQSALRLAGAWCLGLIPLSLMARLDEGGSLAAVGVVAVLTLLVLVAAVALGNGWRSVWWARVGEILEELCIALCLAALPLAAGLFAYLRQLPS